MLIVLAVPLAFSQFRFEIGASAPLLVGIASTSDDGLTGDLVESLDELGIIPIANMGLFLQADLGIIKLGVGAKVHSFLVFSAGYPAAQVSLELGHLAVDASIGGLYYAYYGLGDIYGVEELPFLLPDLSVWLALGQKKNFRLGAGAIGVTTTDMDFSELPFIGYAGLKIVLD